MSLREHHFLKVNIIVLVLVLALISGVDYANLSPSLLFYPPATPPTPIAGLLTHSFQVLCFVPPIVCSFSYYLLQSWRRLGLQSNFLLFSALVTGVFAVNEIYRVHIILLYFDIPKYLTISFYALGIVAYSLAFWRQIRQTSYQILIIAIGFLALAITIDFLQLRNRGIGSLSEGVPKLLSGVNLVLYFWDVCIQEISNTIKRG
jgi:hypothetical protein